jgi:hypothetical protein
MDYEISEVGGRIGSGGSGAASRPCPIWHIPIRPARSRRYAGLRRDRGTGGGIDHRDRSSSLARPGDLA